MALDDLAADPGEGRREPRRGTVALLLGEGGVAADVGDHEGVDVARRVVAPLLRHWPAPCSWTGPWSFGATSLRGVRTGRGRRHTMRVPPSGGLVMSRVP